MKKYENNHNVQRVNMSAWPLLLTNSPSCGVLQRWGAPTCPPLSAAGPRGGATPWSSGVTAQPSSGTWSARAPSGSARSRTAPKVSP